MIMTSRTRAGVKLQRLAVENVWRFCTPLHKHRCNVSIVASCCRYFCMHLPQQNVLLSEPFLRASDVSLVPRQLFTEQNETIQTSGNVSASMQALRVSIIIATTALAVTLVRVSVRDNLVCLNGSCRRHRTHCPAHIHALLHDLAMVQPHCHAIFWRHNKAKLVYSTYRTMV